ncbi:MAG: N-formylglutamate amidohydrolase [Pseudomonadota bacterium]
MTSPPYFVSGPDRPGRWVVTCDHASNRVPEEMGGDLGIDAADMTRHIAYDPGAAGVATHLGRCLDAPVVLSNFSRLVIDPNRAEHDPTLVMKLYDGTIIPRNRAVDATEVERRLNAYHRPYHNAIGHLTATRAPEAIVSIHSFTPQFKGRPPRPWQIAILSASDRRLSDPLLRLLREDGDLIVGDNEPYTGALAGDAMDRHGIQPGRQHTLIEIRNDLIQSEAQQAAWAARLAPHLEAALDEAEV